MLSPLTSAHISACWPHIHSLRDFLVQAKMICAVLYCHHDAFRAAVSVNFIRVKRFWPSEKPHCRQWSIHRFEYMRINPSCELWCILSISLNPVRDTESTSGPQSMLCGLAFIVSLDKQEGEFSLSMTQWLISCFFSSIFFLLCKWAWNCMSWAGGEKKAVTSCKALIAVGCIWLSDACTGVCPKVLWQ